MANVTDWVTANIIAILAVIASCATTLITLTVLYTHISDVVDSLKDEVKKQHETNVSVDGRLNTLTATGQNITHMLEMAKARAQWEADHLQPAAAAAPSDLRRR